jgi:hypothetical protein
MSLRVCTLCRTQIPFTPNLDRWGAGGMRIYSSMPTQVGLQALHPRVVQRSEQLGGSPDSLSVAAYQTATAHWNQLWSVDWASPQN